MSKKRHLTGARTRAWASAVASAGAVIVLLAGLAAPALAQRTAGIPSDHAMKATNRSVSPVQKAILSSIECEGPSFCLAIGQYTKYGQPRQPVQVIEEWDGRNWSAVADRLPGTLSGLTCGSPTFCLAKDSKAGVAAWNGRTWRIWNNQPPSGTSGISCGSPDLCAGIQGTATVQWNGKKWRSGPYSTDACGGQPPGDDCGWSFLTCAGRLNCAVVGWWQPYSDGDFGGIEPQTGNWNGEEWNGSLNPPFTMTLLACSFDDFCLATDGHSQAALYSGPGWQSASPDLAAVCKGASNCSLDGSLSCGAPQSCVLIPSASKLSLVWNGVRWKSVPLVPLRGTHPTLTALSCVSSSDCLAVGRYRTPSRPLTEHWNGSSWQLG